MPSPLHPVAIPDFAQDSEKGFLFDYSKLEAGRLSLAPHAFSLRAMLEQTSALFAASAQEKGLVFHVVEGDDLPQRIIADETQLRSIVANLLHNAIRFTERGEVTLHVARAGDQLRIEVRDTGVGIDTHTLARLFAPFQQGDDTTTRRHGGTGLGLSIAKALVEGMGGTISVTSTVGKGSSFVCQFPLVVAPMADQGPPRPASAANTLDSSFFRCRFQGHVLIAEDNAVNQLVFARMLERVGLQTTVVSDGAAAVREASRGAYDIVFMDCHMPTLDGYDAAMQIRQLPSAGTKAIPIVALTASALAEDRARCLAAGMSEVLLKPIDTAALADVLSRYLIAPSTADEDTPHAL